MQGEKRVEKYQFNLKNLLGQGSYANVYLGRITGTMEQVAVKVIDKRLFLNAYNLKNIQSEIEIMKQLYDVYQTTNNMYIITEYCEEGDLYRMLQNRKKIPEAEARTYLGQIMQGAKYLHLRGIIHRDLKPANILLKKGVCKISDFGFAKNLEGDTAIMKSIVGTPLYMSPQLLKRVKYTAKSDLWSIGLIYYEMLHGRTPWPAKNELQLINAIHSKPVQYHKDISQESKEFIRKCLQIQEDDRMSWDEAFNHRLLEGNSKSEKLERLDKVERTERIQKSGKIEKSDGTQKAERLERIDRTERSERIQKGSEGTLIRGETKEDGGIYRENINRENIRKELTPSNKEPSQKSRLGQLDRQKKSEIFRKPSGLSPTPSGKSPLTPMNRQIKLKNVFAFTSQRDRSQTRRK